MNFCPVQGTKICFPYFYFLPYYCISTSTSVRYSTMIMRSSAHWPSWAFTYSNLLLRLMVVDALPNRLLDDGGHRWGNSSSRDGAFRSPVAVPSPLSSFESLYPSPSPASFPSSLFSQSPQPSSSALSSSVSSVEVTILIKTAITQEELQSTQVVTPITYADVASDLSPTKTHRVEVPTGSSDPLSSVKEMEPLRSSVETITTLPPPVSSSDYSLAVFASTQTAGEVPSTTRTFPTLPSSKTHRSHVRAYPMATFTSLDPGTQTTMINGKMILIVPDPTPTSLHWNSNRTAPSTIKTYPSATPLGRTSRNPSKEKTAIIVGSCVAGGLLAHGFAALFWNKTWTAILQMMGLFPGLSREEIIDVFVKGASDANMYKSWTAPEEEYREEDDSGESTDSQDFSDGSDSVESWEGFAERQWEMSGKERELLARMTERLLEQEREAPGSVFEAPAEEWYPDNEQYRSVVRNRFDKIRKWTNNPGLGTKAIPHVVNGFAGNVIDPFKSMPTWTRDPPGKPTRMPERPEIPDIPGLVKPPPEEPRGPPNTPEPGRQKYNNPPNSPESPQPREKKPKRPSKKPKKPDTPPDSDSGSSSGSDYFDALENVLDNPANAPNIPTKQLGALKGILKNAGVDKIPPRLGKPDLKKLKNGLLKGTGLDSLDREDEEDGSKQQPKKPKTPADILGLGHEVWKETAGRDREREEERKKAEQPPKKLKGILKGADTNKKGTLYNPNGNNDGPSFSISLEGPATAHSLPSPRPTLITADPTPTAASEIPSVQGSWLSTTIELPSSTRVSFNPTPSAVLGTPSIQGSWSSPTIELPSSIQASFSPISTATSGTISVQGSRLSTTMEQSSPTRASFDPKKSVTTNSIQSTSESSMEADLTPSAVSGISSVKESWSSTTTKLSSSTRVSSNTEKSATENSVQSARKSFVRVDPTLTAISGIPSVHRSGLSTTIELSRSTQMSLIISSSIAWKTLTSQKPTSISSSETDSAYSAWQKLMTQKSTSTLGPETEPAYSAWKKFMSQKPTSTLSPETDSLFSEWRRLMTATPIYVSTPTHSSSSSMHTSLSTSTSPIASSSSSPPPRPSRPPKRKPSTPRWPFRPRPRPAPHHPPPAPPHRPLPPSPHHRPPPGLPHPKPPHHKPPPKHRPPPHANPPRYPNCKDGRPKSCCWTSSVERHVWLSCV